MGFFDDPPPEPPEQDEPDPNPWDGPPGNELGVSVPIRIAFVHTDEVSLSLVDVTAYSTGFEFMLWARRRSRDGDESSVFDLVDAFGGARGLRFGVAYADGSKATGESQRGDPPRMALRSRGGSGGSDQQEQGYWAWPLPPPGPVDFVCRWLERGVPEARIQVDAGLIRDAASSSAPLWDASRATGRGRRGGTWQRAIASSPDTRTGDGSSEEDAR